MGWGGGWGLRGGGDVRVVGGHAPIRRYVDVRFIKLRFCTTIKLDKTNGNMETL